MGNVLRQHSFSDFWDELFRDDYPKRDFGNASKPHTGAHGEHFQRGSVALWNHVLGSEGKVDVYTAAQFVESFAEGHFKNNPAITDPRAQQNLGDLEFETVVNLFESISERPIKHGSLYLDLLNRSMGLDQDYYRDRTQKIEMFFSPVNKAGLEKKWEEARREGRIARSEKSFADAMADAFNDPEIVTEGDFKRRKALLQFISDSYSDFVGEPRIEVKLISAQPELGGYHGKDERTGKAVIGINVNTFAFQTNFQSALNTLMHERHHGSQMFLSEKYKAGKIKKGDADYVAARVASANMGKFGYIQPDYVAGALAYRDQPIEVEANCAGKSAEYHAYIAYARPPAPIVSVRDSHRDKAENKGYENLLDHFPGGGGHNGGFGRPPRRPGFGFSPG